VGAPSGGGRAPGGGGGGGGGGSGPLRIEEIDDSGRVVAPPPLHLPAWREDSLLPEGALAPAMLAALEATPALFSPAVVAALEVSSSGGGAGPSAPPPSSPSGAGGGALRGLSRDELVIFSGAEEDAGTIGADYVLPKSEVALRGAEELKWQKKASAAYAPLWTAEESTAFVATLLSALEAHPEWLGGGEGGEVGDLPPAAWLYVLQACAQINPARSASDVRDQYDVVRAAGDAHWAGVVTEALKKLGVGSVPRAAPAPTPPSAPAPAPAGDGAMAVEGAPAPAARAAPPSPPRARAAFDAPALSAAVARVLARLPWRPESAALTRRYSAPNRLLEKSKATLEWEGQVTTAEVAMRAVGGRAVTLGHDRRRRAYYVFGPCPTEVWVEDAPPLRTSPLLCAPGAPGVREALAAPRRWRVVGTSAALSALLDWLLAGGEREGPLRDALLRLSPLLTAGMAAAGVAAPAPAPAIDPAPVPAPAPASSPTPPPLPLSQCCFCGGLSGALGALTLVHCHITHVSFPVSSSRAVSGPAFAAHTAGAWEAARGRPVVRALAVVTAAQAGVGGPLPAPALRALVAAAAATYGAPLDALAEALDPRLLRLKRFALAIGGALDFLRLRNPAHWPPAARAQWAHAVASSLNAGELLRAMGVLEGALRADDIAGAAAAVGPLLQHKPLLDAWLPPWYLQCVPSTAAAAAVPTIAAVALRLHALQRALAPCSHEQVKVYPA
jgi:hypothetical protein